MKIDLNKRPFHQKGFTLLELMVAIAIIAILSTVVIAMTSKARARGRDGQRYSDIRQINNAINLYIIANNHTPTVTGCDTLSTSSCGIADNSSFYSADDWAELAIVLQPYIKKLPKDPCGSSCDSVSTNTFYHYNYSGPGLVRNNYQYSIFAQHLETTLQPFGISTTSTGGFDSQ